MEFKNHSENEDEFRTFKNFKVHNSQYTDGFAQMVTITGKIEVGIQRRSYYEDKNNPRLKSILPPIEAWTTFVSQAVPTLDKAIKEQEGKEPAPTETLNSRKRHYSNGIITPH